MLRTTVPTRTTPVTLGHWLLLREVGWEHGSGSGVGFGELSRPLTQAYPTPVKAGLPPLRCEGGRSARSSQKLGGVGVMDSYWLSTPGHPGSAVNPPPPRPTPPPPRIILELISGHPRQGTSRPEIWCKMTQAQKSRVWVPIPEKWGWGVFSLYPVRAWELSRWGWQAKKTLILLKWVFDFNDDYDVSWCDTNRPPPQSVLQ